MSKRQPAINFNNLFFNSKIQNVNKKSLQVREVQATNAEVPWF